MKPLYLSRLYLVTLSLITLLNLEQSARGWVPVDPTEGFISSPLNQSNFVIQRPFNVPQEQRYSFVRTHKLWVYSTDKPHSPTSHTRPRTEIRVHEYDYSCGVWQFEAYRYVPHGTSGVCIMPVFGASPSHATTLMLRVCNSSLTYYQSPVLIPNIYNRWFRVSVVHDAESSNVECMQSVMVPT